MARSPVPDLSITDAVRIPDDVIFRELNGEAVILNLDNGTYFGLNSVGMRIWQLCEQHGSLRAVWTPCSVSLTPPAMHSNRTSLHLSTSCHPGDC